ncbi:hypothetical protein [Limnoglobus roseus]|uniref:Uncharacterized protein n=1 Tax=Limnoglobus roseus TaxID=2598579 RepID=A0A5C1AHN3_9BACT|nr:hypothetical protein [Limnoglobus roseus]QEL17506.1 hypothetical protein PX52LOC_04495 [Limnoglobus roseus]
MRYAEFAIVGTLVFHVATSAGMGKHEKRPAGVSPRPEEVRCDATVPAKVDVTAAVPQQVEVHVPQVLHADSDADGGDCIGTTFSERTRVGWKSTSVRYGMGNLRPRLAAGPAAGRGAGIRPPNRFDCVRRVLRELGPNSPGPVTEFLTGQSRSVATENRSPAVGIRSARPRADLTPMPRSS